MISGEYVLNGRMEKPLTLNSGLSLEGERIMNKTKKLSPVHSGEILQYDFLGPIKRNSAKP